MRMRVSGDGFSLLIAAIVLFPVSSYATPVFGEDDRKEIYEISDDKVRKLAESTAALFASDAVVHDSRRHVYNLILGPYDSIPQNELIEHIERAHPNRKQ